jgi:putative SOS response-associated peptidase YedK
MGIHDRMPAILPPEAEDSWLDPNSSGDALAALLRPFAGAIAAVEEKPKPRAQGDLFGGA